jgi:hypothetical protein
VCLHIFIFSFAGPLAGADIPDGKDVKWLQEKEILDLKIFLREKIAQQRYSKMAGVREGQEIA